MAFSRQKGWGEYVNRGFLEEVLHSSHSNNEKKIQWHFFVFLISPKTFGKQICLNHSELIALRSSKGIINIKAISPEK